MSPQKRFCPHCGAPQETGAVICRACDQPLYTNPLPRAPDTAAIPTTPFATEAHTLRSNLPAFRSPGSEAWPWLGLLVGMCAAGGAGAFAAGTEGLGYGLGMFSLTLLITLVILWAGGISNAKRGRAFLASERPLVSWVYTAEEWQKVRAYFYEQERSESPPLGCLPVLFSAAGLLAGLMIGFDDGLPEALLGGLIGIAVGAAVGGVLIVPVYLFNRSVQHSALRREDPPAVAIGVRELFYDQLYFDGERHTIYDVQLAADAPPRLLIETFAIRGSFSAGFPGVIPVPPRMLASVQRALPQIERSQS
jgi:hypothetical protein